MDNDFWNNIKNELYDLNQMRKSNNRLSLKLRFEESLAEEKRLKKEIAKKVTSYLLENGDYGTVVLYNVKTDEMKVHNENFSTIISLYEDFYEEICIKNLRDFFNNENWLQDEIEKRI